VHPSAEVAPPLRVLVVISSPKAYSPIDAEREWRRLCASMQQLEQRRMVALERIPATLGALQDQLRCGSYHMLYFIGHGDYDEQRQDGLLLFEDTEGDSDRVSGEELGLLLHDHRSLRLAVLHACEGARTSYSNPFAGVAQCLVRDGLSAVIAIQFAVSGEAATMMAGAFCEALADSYPIDAALAEARKTMFTQSNRDEWATPVLYMRSANGTLFDLSEAAPAGEGSGR
jgi:CHAT domain-containing protein